MNPSISFTLQELYQFYKTSKPQNVSLPWNQAAELFCLEKDIIKDDHEKVYLAFKNLSIKVQREKSKLKKSGKFNNNDGNKVILTVSINNSNAEDYVLQASQDSNSNPHDIVIEEENDNMDVEEVNEDQLIDDKYYKPLNEVCPRQRYRRTMPVIDYLNEAATKNKVTLNELLAIILKQVNYREDKNICDIEKKIIEGEERSSKMSIEKTMHIKQSLKLGRQSYQLLKSCLSNGNNILPTWKELRSEEKKKLHLLFVIKKILLLV